MSGSRALANLLRELEYGPLDGDPFTADKLMTALRAAIERTETDEWEERMGEDL